MNGPTPEKKRWLVLRCAGRQELKLRYELERLRMECFVPLGRRVRMRGERRVTEVFPVVNGIVFVRLDPQRLPELRERSRIRCFPARDCATDGPLTVSDTDMRNFRGVVENSADTGLIYLHSDPSKWNKGQRVRVINGPLCGYEGRFVRVKGDRRVVVEIPGVIAVATGFMHPSMVEPIADDTPRGEEGDNP